MKAGLQTLILAQLIWILRFWLSEREDNNLFSVLNHHVADTLRQ